MRNFEKRFLMALTVSVFSLPSLAYVSTSDTYSADFLKRNGYSDLSIQMVNHERAKAAGVSIESTRKVIKNPILRTLYNAYLYFDPSVEDGQFLNHDIHVDPDFNDL